jgi:hypothetical protein
MSNPERNCAQLNPCSSVNSMLESDLDDTVKQGHLRRLKLMETPEGEFFIVVEKWVDDEKTRFKEWYLCTRRDRTIPKIFMDLTRLNDHLRGLFPEQGFDLRRQQLLPGQGIIQACFGGDNQ